MWGTCKRTFFLSWFRFILMHQLISIWRSTNPISFPILRKRSFSASRTTARSIRLIKKHWRSLDKRRPRQREEYLPPIWFPRHRSRGLCFRFKLTDKVIVSDRADVHNVWIRVHLQWSNNNQKSLEIEYDIISYAYRCLCLDRIC